MSVEERDPYTGHKTTGHDWNRIKELNSRVPIIWYVCFTAAFLFSLGYWIAMPAWPSVHSNTQGLLGFDQKDEVVRQGVEALQKTEHWRTQLVTRPINEIANDEELMALVLRTGPALFEDNCAGCHGMSGEGARNFPQLNDESWLWGSDPDSIYTTLRYGINSDHPQSRIAQMPAFGDTGALDASQIRDVSLYVLSLSSPYIGNGSRMKELLSVRRGEGVYKTQCVACHGAQGQGNSLLGAPNLVDEEWMYGARLDDLVKTIAKGRAGHMPSWEDRLSDSKIRILSLYVPTLSVANPESTAGDEQ